MARHKRYDLGGNLTAVGQRKVQELRDRTPVTPERIAKAHSDALRFEHRCNIWALEEADQFLLECAR